MSGNGETNPTHSALAAGNGQPVRKAPERPIWSAGGQRAHVRAAAVEKSLNFFPSLRRLLGHLAPERLILSLAVLLAVAGVVMNVLGPKILGMATDVIFTGVLGKDLPGGATKEQVVAELRARATTSSPRWSSG